MERDVQMVDFAIRMGGNINVFHHRVDQPTEWIKKAWQRQLMLQLFDFIAIKQGAYIRRASI
jgi:hypothetical protein